MRISSVLVIMLMAASTLTVVAQPATNKEVMKFSLKEAQDYALANSPVLLNSAREVESAKKMVWENTSIGLPQATLSSAYAYTPKLAGLSQLFTGGDSTGGGGSPFGFNINPNDLKTSFNMDIRVSQLIFSGEYLVGLQAARVYASISKLADTKSRNGIVENITDTYYAILIAHESMSILDSSYTTLQKTLFETEQMLKQGFVESTDVDQIRILASNIKSALSVIQRQTEITERLLKFQMGLSIDQQIQLTDDLTQLIDMINLETSVSDTFDVGKNIDFKILATQEKLMHLNLRVKQSEFLPTLAGFYNHHEDFDNNFFNDASPNMFGLSLSFPLWTSGQRLSRVGQARLSYEEAKTNRQMVTESLRIAYENAMSSFISARDVYMIQIENKDLAFRIYKKSITKYHEGVGSSLDLNQTQQQYFDAETKYFGAILVLVAAKAQLDNLLSTSAN